MIIYQFTFFIAAEDDECLPGPNFITNIFYNYKEAIKLGKMLKKVYDNQGSFFEIKKLCV